MIHPTEPASTPAEWLAEHERLVDEIVKAARSGPTGLVSGAEGERVVESARAALLAHAATRPVDDTALLEQALRALQAFPGFAERTNPIHRQRFNEMLVAAIAALRQRLQPTKEST